MFLLQFAEYRAIRGVPCKIYTYPATVADGISIEYAIDMAKQPVSLVTDIEIDEGRFIRWSQDYKAFKPNVTTANVDYQAPEYCFHNVTQWPQLGVNMPLQSMQS